MNEAPLWSVYRRESEFAVIPQTPLLIRLRQLTSDAFFGQEALKPLKGWLDLNFIIGPVCILASMYVGSLGTALVAIGIVSLMLSALYWFASHWLCTTYLRSRGFEQGEPIIAADLDAARAAVGA